jgi:uncharacterized protein (TIGR02996 family)
MRRFEYRDEKSAKFWSIHLQGKRFTIQFGKIGTTGQTQSKEFADEVRAKTEHDKLVAEKVKKGYAEVGATPAPAPAETATPTSKATKRAKAAAPKKDKGAATSTQAAPPPSAPAAPLHSVPAGPPKTGVATLDGLLAAVCADPDDDAARLVLADWLDESGEADRAELIRVQCRMSQLAAAWDRSDAPPGISTRKKRSNKKRGQVFYRANLTPFRPSFSALSRGPGGRQRAPRPSLYPAGAPIRCKETAPIAV